MINFHLQEVEELEGKRKLKKWLNINFRIEMTDGRILIGVFLCTDRDANVILGEAFKAYIILIYIIILIRTCKQFHEKYIDIHILFLLQI